MDHTALKTLLHHCLLFLRRATAFARPMPDFLIVGAQKSGTTSLARWLDQHPDLQCALGKEVHYFDSGRAEGPDLWRKGPSWYRAHFPIRLPGSRKLAFEATPMYLFHPLAAERIYSTIPNAKIVVLLRNPTDRAVSHYHHSLARGHENQPLENALSLEKERLAPLIASGDYRSGGIRRHSYKARGMYANQVRRFKDLFPPDRLLIIRSEKLFEQPHETLNEVVDFIGATHGLEQPQFAPQNMSENKADVPRSTRDSLDAGFEQPNRELAELLGRDLGW